MLFVIVCNYEERSFKLKKRNNLGNRNNVGKHS